MFTARSSRATRPGLALVVIATAQLMVVLDATIVNVALPHIQRALGFSGNGLEWVITAYALSFGGLLLLGGRAGDLLGRRRVFISGLLLFSAASFVGGFATSQSWLLAARAFQGAGGALIAPTALALVATNFAEGPARNRAMAVVAAMSGAGAAVGLVAGGLLTTYLSWRWVLFVNAPIGLLAATAAAMVLAESPRRRGRFDLAGAITGTAGVALLVYGLSNASTDQYGISHWGDTKVVISLIAAAALLTAFVIIERRSRYALMPLRILADRNRSGANLIMLVIATAMFGIFFFLSLFVQSVLGYSPVKSGLAFLPLAAVIVVFSGIVSQVITRTGARPLILTGAAFTSGGMYWFSRVDVHTTYLGGLLGPILVTATGLGLLFVPLSLAALSRVRDEESGLASSLLNTGQQVGGAIGLAALGTVAWTTVANSTRHQIAHAAATTQAVGSGHPLAQARLAVIHRGALAAGISRGLLTAAAIALAGLVIGVATIRVRPQDQPVDTPATDDREPTVDEPDMEAVASSATSATTTDNHDSEGEPSMNATTVHAGMTAGSVVSKDGTPIGYFRTGQGPAVVLIHGSNQSARSHTQLALTLADAFTVYLPDRRGRGRSGPHRSGHSMRTEVEDLEAVLAESGASRVFGVSVGALIALEAARTRAAIRQVAAYEPALLAQPDPYTGWVGRFDEEIGGGNTAAALVTSLYGLDLAPTALKLMPRTLLEAMTNKAMRSEDKKAKNDTVTMRQLAPTLRYEGLLLAEMAGTAGTFADLDADVLLIGGAMNRPAFIRPAFDALAQTLPHRRCVVIPRLGHGGSSDVGPANRDGKPERVAPVIQSFFAGHD